MQAFSQLKTLRLCAWRDHPWSINSLDLDMACVQSLRRLHIEDWSPKIITVAKGCRVYAKWQRRDKRALEWLDSPCWGSSDIALASLHVEDKYRWSFQPSQDEVDAIQTILQCHDELKSLTIDSITLESEEVPLILASHDPRTIGVFLRADITTKHGCWLHLHDTSPVSENLSLNTKGPLHVGTTVSGRLQWFALEGSSASSAGEGPAALQWQLSKAMHRYCSQRQEYHVAAAANLADGDQLASAAVLTGSCAQSQAKSNKHNCATATVVANQDFGSAWWHWWVMGLAMIFNFSIPFLILWVIL